MLRSDISALPYLYIDSNSAEGRKPAPPNNLSPLNLLLRLFKYSGWNILAGGSGYLIKIIIG